MWHPDVEHDKMMDKVMDMMEHVLIGQLMITRMLIGVYDLEFYQLRHLEQECDNPSDLWKGDPASESFETGMETEDIEDGGKVSYAVQISEG